MDKADRLWYKIHMEDEEISKIEEWISGKESFLEWGSGGSTLYYSQFVDHYVSIEHDEGWFNKTKEIIEHRGLDNIEYHFVPTNEIKFDDKLDTAAIDLLSKSYNYKVESGIAYATMRHCGEKDWHCFVDYINKPLEFNKKFDIVFVDGRARTMCAYNALNIIKDDGYLLFHDFKKYQQDISVPERIDYHTILKYYEIVDYSNTLVILKKNI